MVGGMKIKLFIFPQSANGGDSDIYRVDFPALNSSSISNDFVRLEYNGFLPTISSNKIYVVRFINNI